MNNIYSNLDIESKLVFGTPKNDLDLSIMIPTYKRMELLRKTLLSIVKQKKPKTLKYQVFIISNDPNFDYEMIGLELDPMIFCVYVNNQNLGMVGNMNRCTYLSKGRFVAFIQDDDLLLDDYLIEIEKLIIDGKMNGVDCLIPSSYYFYDKKENGVFGQKSIKSNRIKRFLKAIIRFGRPTKLLQKVNSLQCVKAWYNAFGGGPTNGIVLDRNTLMETNGFNPEIKYVFDQVFFYEFATKHNTYLFKKYLAISRATDSFSNRVDVQEDFLLNGDMYLIRDAKAKSTFVGKYENEIIRFSVENKCDEIKQKYKHLYCKNELKYFWYRFVRLFCLLNFDLFRKRNMPKKYLKLL